MFREKTDFFFNTQNRSYVSEKAMELYISFLTKLYDKDARMHALKKLIFAFPEHSHTFEEMISKFDTLAPSDRNCFIKLVGVETKHMKTLPEEYSEYVGSGTFGDVYGSVTDPTRVAKAIRRSSMCKSNRNEFMAHLDVYNVWKTFGSTKVKIARPYEFYDLREDDNYSCMYVMERLRSPRKDGQQVHLIMNSDIFQKSRSVVGIGYFQNLFESELFYGKENVIGIVRSIGEMLL